MADSPRLRQVCLAAAELEPVVETVGAVLGLPVCHRDPAVRRFGLENALFRIDTRFVEVVAPIEPDTAAQRFVDRTGSHGGYMAIFDCADPGAWKRHAEGLGVRTAHELREGPYHGVQLHPRDCRGAMIELNHTEGGKDLYGPYAPAGGAWQRAPATGRALAMPEIELESPDPPGLARHWSAILDIPLTDERTPRMELSHGAIRCVPTDPGRRECLGAVDVVVDDPDDVLAAAAKRDCPTRERAFHLAGVWFRLTPA